MVISPRYSFEGYKVTEAIYRNKDLLKNVVAILGAYTTYQGATGFNWKSFLIAVGGALLVFGFRIIQDALDFYFTEVEL